MDEQNVIILTDAKKTYSRLGLALLVMTLGTLGAEILIGVSVGVASRFGYAFPEVGWVNWVVTFVPLYVVGIPAALLILKKVPVEPCEQTKLNGKDFFLLLLMCVPLMYIGNLIGNFLSSLFSGGTAENVLLDYVFDESILKILVMVVLAPLLEEFLFRKALLDRAARYGEKTAILFSALTFGLFHMNLYQFFYAFALGWLFAFVYIRTRRLRYPVILHMFVNFLGSVLAPWLVSGLDMEVVEQMSSGVIDEAALLAALPGPAAYMIYALGLIVLSAVGVVLMLVKAPMMRLPPELIPRGQRLKTAYGNVGIILFFLICAAMFTASLFL